MPGAPGRHRAAVEQARRAQPEERGDGRRDVDRAGWRRAPWRGAEPGPAARHHERHGEVLGPAVVAAQVRLDRVEWIDELMAGRGHEEKLAGARVVEMPAGMGRASVGKECRSRGSAYQATKKQKRG